MKYLKLILLLTSGIYAYSSCLEQKEFHTNGKIKSIGYSCFHYDKLVKVGYWNYFCYSGDLITTIDHSNNDSIMFTSSPQIKPKINTNKKLNGFSSYIVYLNSGVSCTVYQFNRIRHRKDAPAVICSNGYMAKWINGIKIEESHYGIFGKPVQAPEKY